jgi:hypothetical protein
MVLVFMRKKMTRGLLRNDQWERIKEHLPGKASDCGVTAADNRLFVEAVLRRGEICRPASDIGIGFMRAITVRVIKAPGQNS